MPFELPPNVDSGADWRSRPFAVIDTETTGIERNARAVEIAIVTYDGHGNQLEEWSSLVNPGCAIPAGAQKAHKISDKMVADAPTFTDLYPEMVKMLRGMIGHTIMAYNMPYDYFILMNEAKRLEKPWGAFFGVDPLVLARQLIPDMYNYKLTTCLKRFGLFDEDATNHRALQDVKDTATLFFQILLPRFRNKYVSYQGLWDRQVELALQHEKRMQIKRNGKPTNMPWHDLVRGV